MIWSVMIVAMYTALEHSLYCSVCTGALVIRGPRHCTISDSDYALPHNVGVARCHNCWTHTQHTAAIHITSTIVTEPVPMLQAQQKDVLPDL